MEAYETYKIERPPKQEHAAAPLLNYTREHSVSVNITRGMNKEEPDKELSCGAHASAIK